MTERGRRRLAALWLAVGAVMAPPARAAAPAAGVSTFTLGYLEIAGDRRYAPRPGYAGIVLRQRRRPYPGAETALRESRILGRALRLRFRLERVAAASSADLVAAIDRLHREAGVRFFLVDASAATLRQIGRQTRARELLMFNVSERSDRLRAAQCEPHMMHVLPSDAMLMDALVQYIVSRRWRRVLVLAGPLPADRTLVRAFERSAKRFGARIVAQRAFVLSNDPRERGKSNVALLTAGAEHDVVFLADSDGEFGRYVPYRTNRPRPVIGSEGLRADTWHWSWERHGAPQLNQRFEKRAGRRMQGPDWAAWAAVKAIIESVVRTRSTDFATVTAYLKSDRLTLDGYKGTPLSFRPWNNQLRQAILLRTHNAIVARAPLTGFLHPTEYLDTLGFDRAESRCRR